MRLQEIRLRGYHVLDDFTLTFFQDRRQAGSEDTHTLDLLVGVNGSGKSSLLRALAEIFQALYRGKQPGFGFRVTYYLQTRGETTRQITIGNLDQEDEPRFDQPLSLQVDGRDEGPVHGDSIDPAYLPDWVIALTSGNESGWELVESQLGEEGERPETIGGWYLRELASEGLMPAQTGPVTPMESKYLFIRTELLALVVLCGFLQDMAQQSQPRSPRFLRDALQECKLTGLRGFSLSLRINVLDPRDRQLITNLRQKAQRSIQRGSDHLLVFSLSQGETQSVEGEVRPGDLLALEATCLRLFQRLVRLYRPGGGAPAVLRGVNLFFQRATPQPQSEEEEEEADQAPLLLFDWLSDGEQSFLGRLGLFALFEANVAGDITHPAYNSEALILLDEPEVHFNDYWKRQLVLMLTEALTGTPRHVLMTTHSSITLSDVSGANIWKLQREGNYTPQAHRPAIRTLGADPSDILVAVFGAENAVGAQSVAYIRREINRARSQAANNRADEGIRLLSELFDKLGPGYWRYLVRRELDALETQNR